MLTNKKRKPSFKIWLEHNGRPILGKGGAEILEQIEKEKSISKAAKKLDMSYRYAWNRLREIEQAVGEPIMETFRGGESGGGGAKLTKLGKSLIDEYRRLERYLDEALSDIEYSEALRLKISARNRLRGKVVAVEKETITAKVKIKITSPATVTALVSREAVEDLDIKVGDKVQAVVKATEVMIAK